MLKSSNEMKRFSEAVFLNRSLGFFQIFNIMRNVWRVTECLTSSLVSLCCVLFWWCHMNRCCVIIMMSMFVVLCCQCWGWICAHGGRRSDVQDLCHPTQKREGAGGRGDHHPPEPRKQTRDLVRPDHQLIEAHGGDEEMKVNVEHVQQPMNTEIHNTTQNQHSCVTVDLSKVCFWIK